MNIAVVHTAVSEQSTPDDRDVLDQVAAVTGALGLLDHAVSVFSCDLDLVKVESRLNRFRPDVVFNLVESLDGHMRLIHLFPALLDAMALRYTGSGAEALWITTHKGMAKAKMAAAGLSTPPWISADTVIDAPETRVFLMDAGLLQQSWIIKSLWEHASVGLDEDRIVSPGSLADLTARMKKLSAQTGDAFFAEAFIDGREFNISILGGPDGPQVLAPAEIVFEGYDKEKPKIVGYRAKWVPESWEYRHTLRRFDFSDNDRGLLKTLKDLSISCWQVFDLRGYARVDFRVDPSNRPRILEVNANPCLSPDSGFSAALSQSGITFPEAIARILHDALQYPL